MLMVQSSSWAMSIHSFIDVGKLWSQTAPLGKFSSFSLPHRHSLFLPYRYSQSLKHLQTHEQTPFRHTHQPPRHPLPRRHSSSEPQLNPHSEAKILFYLLFILHSRLSQVIATRRTDIFHMACKYLPLATLSFPHRPLLSLPAGLRVTKSSKCP